MFFYIFMWAPFAHAYSIQGTKNNGYLWIGTHELPFTEQEYQNIITNYNLVILHMPKTIQFETSIHLHQLNPNIKTLVYWRTQDIPNNTESYFLDFGFKDSYYLRDPQGNKVPKTSALDRNVIVGYFIDLTKPVVRQWVLNTMKKWVDRGQFDGIAIDEVIPLSINNLDENIVAAIGQEKLDAWNIALFDLAKNVKTTHPNWLVVYNNHNYSLLESNLDGMLEEVFCYSGRRVGSFETANNLLKHINLLQKYGQNKKIILEKDNFRYSLSPEDIAHVGRYCYGAFLMGYVPEYGKYKFGPGYFFIDEITTNPLEMNLPLGIPEEEYQNNDNLLSRKFENGRVYVNLDTTNKNIILPETLTLVNGGTIGKKYSQGESVDILKNDALFFVKVTSNIPRPGDFNNDGNINDADFRKIKTEFSHPYTIFDYNILVENWEK